MQKLFRMVTVAAVMMFALSGCSVAQSVTKAIDAASTPKMGQCWSASPKQIFDDTVWAGGAAVACTSRHDVYTFGVAELPAKLTAESWLASAKDRTVTTVVDDAAFNACFDEQDSALAVLDTNLQNRFAFVYHLPSVSSWLRGAHWVRCDYSLYSFGSTQAEPTFDALPASHETIVDQLVAHPEKFQFCLNTTEAATLDSDPLNDPKATYADCSGSPQWREVRNDYFGDDIVLYPGDDAVSAFEQKTCDGSAKDGELWIPYGPSRDTWAYGDREVECWVASGTAAVS